MSLYLSEKVGNEIVLKKCAPTVLLYRGFWAIIVGGFAGTLVSCGTDIRYIGSNEKTTYQILEPGTYTFTATRHGETITKTITLDDKDPNNTYTVNLPMYIGIEYLTYIESTGTQFIDTGVIQSEYKQNLIIEFDLQFTELPDQSWSNPKNYSSGCSGDPYYFLPFSIRSTGKFSSNIGNGGTDIDPIDGDLNRHTVIIDTSTGNGTLKIDNQTFNYSSNTANLNKSIYLFRDNSTSLTSVGKLKLYSCKFKTGDGTLIRDFVPIADDTKHGALYDKVTKEIYYNSGEGDFILGPRKPYTKIQYIEGTTCEQYIDTGIIPTSDMTYYGKFGFVEFISSQNILQLFGSRNVSGTPNGVYASVRSTGTGLDFFDTNRYELSTSVTRDDVFDFTIENRVSTIKKNGTVVGTYTFSTTIDTTDYPLHLNALISGGVVDNIKGTSRIYSFKVLSHGTLIRDMIPILDNEGIPCMLDQVEDRLYYNSGTGEFIAGPEIVELEYIESTGTQYIDTGFKPNQDTRVIMTYLKQSGNDDIGWLFGSRNSQSVSSFGTFYDSNPEVIQTDYGDQRNSITNRIYNKKLTVDKNKNVTKIIDFDTGDTLATNTSAERTFSSSYNLCLSAINSGGSVTPSKTKSIYSCKIYDNGTLVRDFIPMRIGTEVGMYDTVTKTLFTNAGTGSFVPGPVK